MKDWERIKHIRKDMSEFVLHCTRGRTDREGGEQVCRHAFDVLKLILQDGFFRAGFAIGQSALARKPKPKIRGAYPAVCFTEQPLWFFIQSIKANRRYTEFAIAVRKDELFNYGGRPVIYADEQMLNQVPPDLQYLWVHYDPTVIWYRDYPIDLRTSENGELALTLDLISNLASLNRMRKSQYHCNCSRKIQLIILWVRVPKQALDLPFWWILKSAGESLMTGLTTLLVELAKGDCTGKNMLTP